LLLLVVSTHGAAPGFDYRVLATNRVSTLEKEMNEAAANGYRFSQFTAGETSFGGQELVMAMLKPLSSAEPLATYRVFSADTSSGLEKQLKAAGDDGFMLKGSVLFREGSGPAEPVCILERNQGDHRTIAYKFLSAARTSAMQKDLQDAGKDGYVLQ